MTVYSVLSAIEFFDGFQDYENMRGARTNQQELIIMRNKGSGGKNDADDSCLFVKFPLYNILQVKWIIITGWNPIVLEKAIIKNAKLNAFLKIFDTSGSREKPNFY